MMLWICLLYTSTRAKEELGWVATRGIDEMCRDTWNFAKTRMK